MPNAIFTASVSPEYDDVLEERYHFPKQYLGRVRETVGDWIIYYEPRRGGGRLCYFAMAQVLSVEPDPEHAGHFYARLGGYQEFPEPVNLRPDGVLIESFLRNQDGSLNNGAAINAVRLLPRPEFETICRLGLSPTIEDLGDTLPESHDIVAETQSEYGGARSVAFARRPVRDAAFSRLVRASYAHTCAFTGLRLAGERGFEVEAAHIRAVEADGPDSPRNGLALSRAIHWLFDEGFLSIADNGSILQAKRLVPDRVKSLLNRDGMMRLPTHRTAAPHAAFLRWHREHRFKG